MPKNYGNRWRALPNQSAAKARQNVSAHLLGDGIAKRGDLSADRGTQGRKGADDCDRNQSCGNSIFRQFKTRFIAKEFANHLFAPLVWLWPGYFVRLLPRRKKAREGCYTSLMM